MSAAPLPGSRRPRYDSMRSSASDIGWRPPSPSFSTTTTGSRMHMPPGMPVISRKDLRQSIACFEELMAAAKAYRNALLAMSHASAAFAQAMEACSRVKGCRSANSPLASSSALQHLLANHEQLLADTVYRQFELPLLSALDHYKLVSADRLAAYEARLASASARLRKTEAENLKGGRRRRRDLEGFRAALGELQRQVEEMEGLKGEYHEEVLEGEDEIWDTVLSKVAFVVRSQLDFYEKIAGKASDPVLEPLVMSIPDPFDSYGPPKEDGHIFSVLAPLGMLDSVPQSPTPALTRTPTSPPSSGRASPTRSAPLTMSSLAELRAGPAPVRAETGTSAVAVQALGFGIGPVDENELDGQEGSGSGSGSGRERDEGRARRELSVIEERAGMDVEAEEAEGKAGSSQGRAVVGREGSDRPLETERENNDGPRSDTEAGLSSVESHDPAESPRRTRAGSDGPEDRAGLAAAGSESDVISDGDAAEGDDEDGAQASGGALAA